MEKPTVDQSDERYSVNKLKVLLDERAARTEYQKQLAEQEKSFDRYREEMRLKQLELEKKLQVESAAREANFRDREESLMRRQKTMEMLLAEREREVEGVRHHLKEEVFRREEALQLAQQELQQEKDRYNNENRDRLQKTSKNYVEQALSSLQVQETKFHKSSENWSAIGAGALIVALVFFGAITLASAYTLPDAPTWEVIVFLLVKGLIAIALLTALARYAFVLSNSYVREALKNADRRHAINFGKFYLESYGAAAEWSQVKDAFEHWNISGSNAFSKQPPIPSEAQTPGKIEAVVEHVRNAMPRSKESEKN